VGEKRLKEPKRELFRAVQTGNTRTAQPDVCRFVDEGAEEGVFLELDLERKIGGNKRARGS